MIRKKRKFNRFKNIIIAMLLTIAMLGETIPVAAAEGDNEDFSIEYWGQFSDLEDTDITYDPDIMPIGGSLFWTLAHKATRISGKFYKNAGEKIVIVAHAYPETDKISVGIIQPDESVRYFYNNGAFSGSFALTMSGYYRIYATNKTGHSVNVIITYS